jgi:hypothetical protein
MGYKQRRKPVGVLFGVPPNGSGCRLDFDGAYRLRSRRDFDVPNFQEEINNAFPTTTDSTSGNDDQPPAAENEDNANAFDGQPRRRFIAFPDGFCRWLRLSV